MTIASGERLGPYEIIGAIGAGGMGEVYRARDTRLDRVVAIKVLPDHLADRTEVRERFDREARTIAGLTHSHICTLYDVGHQGRVAYLVMEYLEGETLAARLEKGPLPLEQALQYAIEIADALDKAHRKGITHRDLKPGNIMLTKSGAKLLDFGLAKLQQEVAPAAPALGLPTVMGMTAEGTILGTVQYMAPEQVEAGEVDSRTDIFAFGAVIYEMTTGKKAFEGKSSASVMAKILESDPPPMSSLQPMAPTALDRVVKKCLAKDPDKRWQSASDLRDELKWIVEGGSSAGMPAAALAAPVEVAGGASGAKREKLAWALVALLGLIAAALGAMHFLAKPPAAPGVVRLLIHLPDKTSFTKSGTLVLSPDGRRVAFHAIGPDGKPHIWIQDIDAVEARPLSDTDISFDSPPPFWSPDGRFIAFSGTSKLEKVDASSGAVQAVCDKPGPIVGGSWNSDGQIIFGSNKSGLWKVPADGGTVVSLTALDSSRHEEAHQLPQFLPDSRHFLYLRVSDAPGQSGEYVGSLDDPPDRQNMKQILATNFGAAYIDSGDGKTGQLLFVRDTTLMAQQFDLGDLKLEGQASAVAERIGTSYNTAQFSAAANVLVYKQTAEAREYQLTWIDDQGKIIGTVGDPGEDFGSLRISPDGTRVVFSRASPNSQDSDLWILDVARGTSMRFTFGPGSNEYPVWSPDGREIVFSSNRDGGVYNLYRKPVDGSTPEQLILQSGQNKAAISWSQDGKFVSYQSQADPVNDQVWALPMVGDAKPIPVATTTNFDQGDPKFSPDGRYVAYVSNETGKYEIYVQEFNGSSTSAAPGGKWIISDGGGFWPMWRADGKELLYVGGDRMTIMSVTIDGAGHSFQAGAPRPLFHLPLDRSSNGVGTVAYTPDLKRFLVAAGVEEKNPQSFVVTLNWTSALKP